jgi:hypothetical protein
MTQHKSDTYFHTSYFLIWLFAVLSINPFYALPVYAQGSVPELPRVYVDTSMPSQSGTVRLVNSTNCNDPSTGLQAQLNAAQRGDIIEIPANLTCIGSYDFPVKSGTGWIVIRTSRYAELTEGKRVNPSQSQLMPKILVNGAGPAITIPSNASYYRLIGLEISITPDALRDADQGGGMNYQLMNLGNSEEANIDNVPHHLIIDRCYIHGLTKKNVKRGVMMSSTYTAVIDSYISEIHVMGLGDTQAIASWNSPGPFKIVNNYLEAAGENILFGGAKPNLPTLVISDIEIRNNHFFKPFTWKLGSGDVTPSGECLYDSRYGPDGENYALKDGSGAVVDWYKCVQGAWVQTGIKPDSVSLYGGWPEAWPVKNLFEIKNGRRVLVEGNIFENNWVSAQHGWGIVLTVRTSDSGDAAVVEDITFRKNIVRRSYNGVNMLGRDDLKLLNPGYAKNILIQNNLFEQVGAGRKPGDGAGIYQILTAVQGLVIDHNTALGNHTIVVVGAGSPSPNINFINNLQLYGTYGIFGDAKGSGNPAINYYFPDSTFTQNVFIAPPAGHSKLYPPTGYFWPATVSEVGFVDYHDGVGGDYRLSSASPYKNLGTDGKDIGADIDALMAATACAISGNCDATALPPLVAPDLSGLEGRTFGVRDEIGFLYALSGVTFEWTIKPGNTDASGRQGTDGITVPAPGQGSELPRQTMAWAPQPIQSSVPRFSLAQWALEPGRYVLSVKVARGVETKEVSAHITLVSADLSAVKVYPNPWRKDKHATKSVTFDGLTLGTDVKIFTVSGHLIKKLATDGPKVEWDLANESWDKVASGIYLYSIANGQGQKVRGKVTVIR